MPIQSGSIQEAIESLLSEGLRPLHLSVENESHMHSVPENSETHFRVVVVADAFKEQRQVQCHQAVYGLLKEIMGNPIHALALHTYGPYEWKQAQNAPESPACMGGSAKEASH